MFARKNTNLPQEPVFPANLDELGYTVNEEGQFVSIGSSHSFFPYYMSNNARVNDLHKEAMHQAARDAVKRELSLLGVRVLYCCGEGGATVTRLKPEEEAFVRLVVTEPSVLKYKKDVVVVVGEHNQDVGIWAYRSLMKAGGMNAASALGLVKMLHKLEFDGLPDDMELGVRGGGVMVSATNDSVAGNGDTQAAPGVILLNPGQRLYSPDLNESMTQETWMARPKTSAIGNTYKIHEVYNRVPGHTTPYEHVETVFEHVIPQLVDVDNVRLWVVGISDGAEHFINYMDSELAADHTAEIGRLVAGMAFMEPTHDATKLQSQAMKASLHALGKSWIKSSRPKGTWINAPNAMKPIKMPSVEDLTKVESAEEAEMNENVGGGDSMLSSKSGNEGTTSKTAVEKAEPGQAVETGTETPIVGAAPVMIAKPSENDNTTSKDDEDLPVSPKSCEQAFLEPAPADSKRTASPIRSMTSLKSFTSKSGRRSSVISHKSNSPSLTTLPEDREDEDDDDPMAGSYDYYTNTVSCPTFSAGVDIDELIFPTVMDEVLDFFKTLAEEDNHRNLVRRG